MFCQTEQVTRLGEYALVAGRLEQDLRVGVLQDGVLEVLRSYDVRHLLGDDYGRCVELAGGLPE